MARDEYETWIFFSFLRAACVCFCVCVSCFCCCCVSDDRIDGIDQNRRPVRIDWWIERSDPFDRQSRNGQKNERGTTRKKSSTFLPKVPNEWHYPSDFIEFFPKIRGNFFEKIWKWENFWIGEVAVPSGRHIRWNAVPSSQSILKRRQEFISKRYFFNKLFILISSKKY